MIFECKVYVFPHQDQNQVLESLADCDYDVDATIAYIFQTQETTGTYMGHVDATISYIFQTQETTGTYMGHMDATIAYIFQIQETTGTYTGHIPAGQKKIIKCLPFATQVKGFCR